VQNGLLALHAPRAPLLLDPHLQALRWLRTKFGTQLIAPKDHDAGLVQISLARPLPAVGASLSACAAAGRPAVLVLVGADIPGALLPFLDQATEAPSSF
jgi:hypothetical protein